MTVVEDVIANVRESFLDEGMDEQVLIDLKDLWQGKLNQSRALDPAAAALAQAPQQSAGRATEPAATQMILQQPVAGNVVQPQINAAQLPQGITMMAANQGSAYEMSGAAQTATLALPPGLYPQHLATALQNNTVMQAVGQDGTQYIIQPAMGGQQQQVFQVQSTPGVQHAIQPPQLQTRGVQQVQQTLTMQTQIKPDGSRGQLDGQCDTSSDDDDDDDDDDDKVDDDDEDQNEEDLVGDEEEPLNSDDDISENEDPSELFDTDNVVVCQFDKINRNKNKWKFHLKDGIMNLNGKDFVFQRANGEAEW